MGYALRCPEEVVKDFLLRQEELELVEENQVMQAMESQENPPSWGLDRIDQRNLPLDKK
jgi:hypothetical protein